jgi:hypothetical protein
MLAGWDDVSLFAVLREPQDDIFLSAENATRLLVTIAVVGCLSMGGFGRSRRYAASFVAGRRARD